MPSQRAPISLNDVVTTLCAPIQEEHAWALIYLGLKKMLEVSQEKMVEKCYLVKRLEDLVISPDGTIHEDSFVKKNDTQERVEMTNLGVGVADLAASF